MATSLYDLTVPVYVRSLTNLSAILAKGSAFAAEKGLDPADLLATRLVEDMAPLTAQVQRATDTAKGTMVRVGGVGNVVFEDNEASFEALQERIAKAIAFIRAVPRAALDGKEEAAVSLDLPDGRSIPFTGQSLSSASQSPISSSTSPPPTPSCATAACRSASSIISAGSELAGVPEWGPISLIPLDKRLTARVKPGRKSGPGQRPRYRVSPCTNPENYACGRTAAEWSPHAIPSTGASPSSTSPASSSWKPRRWRSSSRAMLRRNNIGPFDHTHRF